VTLNPPRLGVLAQQAVFGTPFTCWRPAIRSVLTRASPLEACVGCRS